MSLAGRRRIASAITLSTYLALTTIATTAAAEETEPRADNRARAQQLFESALTDAEAGNFAAACPKFLASQEADPKASTLLNLASCYEKNGQTASAWGAFRDAESMARKTGKTEWEATAKSHAAALEPMLLRLTVVVPEASRASGLVVTRDGVRLSPGEWGVAIPVDPGEHVVTASADGKQPWRTSLDVKDASSSLTVPTLESVPEPAAPVLAPALPERPAEKTPGGWSTLKTAGAISAGVGLVALGTGGVLGLIANGNYGDARQRCSAAPKGCPADAVADSDAAFGLARGATIVFVVGAVAAAAGAVLFFVAPESEARAASKPLRIGVGPTGVIGRW